MTLLIPRQRFRRNVQRSTDSRRQLGLFHGRVEAEKDIGGIGSALIDGETKVSDPHVTLPINEDVGRLEIAMDNAVGGSIRKRFLVQQTRRT